MVQRAVRLPSSLIGRPAASLSTVKPVNQSPDRSARRPNATASSDDPMVESRSEAPEPMLDWHGKLKKRRADRPRSSWSRSCDAGLSIAKTLEGFSRRQLGPCCFTSADMHERRTFSVNPFMLWTFSLLVHCSPSSGNHVRVGDRKATAKRPRRVIRLETHESVHLDR